MRHQYFQIQTMIFKNIRCPRCYAQETTQDHIIQATITPIYSPPYSNSHSVTDILKHRTNILQIIRRFLPEQQILNLAQRSLLPIVNKMIPCARVTI